MNWNLARLTRAGRVIAGGICPPQLSAETHSWFQSTAHLRGQIGEISRYTILEKILGYHVRASSFSRRTFCCMDLVGLLRELRMLLMDLPAGRFYTICVLVLLAVFAWWFG